MMKQIIFVLIFLMLIGAGLQTIAAAPDGGVPVLSAVVKTPDVPLPTHYSPPSVVSPVSPAAGPPVSRSPVGIVHSPVMGSYLTGQSEQEQATASVNASKAAPMMNQSYAPDRVIVKFKTSGLSSQSSVSQIQAEAHAALGAMVIADAKTLGVEGMQVVSVPNSTGTMKAIGLYKMNPMVEYAQPDYIYHASPVEPIHIPVQVNEKAISYRTNVVQGTAHVPSTGSTTTPSPPAIQNPAVSSGVSTGPVSATNESEGFGYMHFSLEDVARIQSEYNAAVKVKNAPLSTTLGSKSLLSNIQYTPSERNQGNCGNCWVWASTGVIENALTVQNGIKDRLSIQYFDSNYNGGSATTGACNGGWASTFANFYSTSGFKQVIPWSNTNAYYNDRYACSYGCGAQTPASSISTTPNHPVTSISTSWLSTYRVSQAQAIANIKAQIDANKAVWWAFFLPDSSSWSAFSSYWSGHTEAALWNPDTYNNKVYGSSGGGHAVIIVGYDDSSSDPNQRYWIVLNSWGSNSGRPNGLFRLKMNMDYSGRSSNGYQSHYFSIFNVNYGASTQTGSIYNSSNPTGARIWLDGTDTGKNTPNTLSSVTAGTHSVTNKLPNYNDYTTSATVTGGQTTTVQGSLTPSGSTSSISNDPYASYLWGLHNTGQTGGTADADIDAPEAWAVTKGSTSVIVGVVDTGVDYNHPDLKANMVGGYNAITGTTNPMDDNGHGTHCAGTIGAVGNNGIGVVGVNWNVKIMPLKFLSSSGSGYTSDAIEAFAWGYNRGVRIFSNSWGGYGTDTALQDAISQYSDALFICAAGNDGSNTDVSPQSPSALPNANIIAVAATDHRDSLASFSNYGASTVDVAAPGVSIYSTYRGGSYTYMSGTSMATPHVAGIAALIKAVKSGYTVAQVKQAILSGVDKKSGLSGKCVTGGRVNALQSVHVIEISNGIAMFRPSIGWWFFDNDLDGRTDKSFQYGINGDIPLVGDWTGNGKVGIAMFRPSIGWWFFDNDLDGRTDKSFQYGINGDIPLVGDWTGNGKVGIAMFRPSIGWWFFDNDLDGRTDKSFQYGINGDIPLVGDWTGNGKVGIAMFRPSIGWWFFDNDLDGRTDKSFRYGINGDVPLVGDWTGNGKVGIAMFRPSIGWWFFDNDLDGRTDKSFQYGINGDIPLVGDWTGNGKVGIAMFRPSIRWWFFDNDLDGRTDKSFQYGINGDICKAIVQ
ncbi:S8 family serine peptidase [Methanospirillum purgamenti]|uniref:S8 family serine peptidase n=1 Tax=Methanospirillum hungatei TaxID=2203 RepID=A0A8F5VLK0_METHU|nr:S8 family serine peptidase [Methanospirillum hungatei]QXO93540.1 S8 family serine peptidase [Methanospirillum hungatei]